VLEFYILFAFDIRIFFFCVRILHSFSTFSFTLDFSFLLPLYFAFYIGILLSEYHMKNIIFRKDMMYEFFHKKYEICGYIIRQREICSRQKLISWNI